MPTSPTRSPGVLLAPLGDGAVAFDLVTEHAHHLNATAGAVLAACDGSADPTTLATDWAEQTGTDPARVTDDITAILDTYRDLGLIERAQPWQPPHVRTGSSGSAGLDRTEPHVACEVLDSTIAIECHEADVADRVRTQLGLSASDGEPSIVLETGARADGGVDLVGDQVWPYDSVATLVDQIGRVINAYAADSATCLTLHAGGVRAPDGRVVVLPAVSGGGKSTLTAAFLAHGWGYLGDEIIGVDLDSGDAIGYPRRLALDTESREALGLGDAADGPDVDPEELRPGVSRLSGPVGPIDVVLSPKFQSDAECEVSPLGTTEAFNLLLANTLNLARVGQAGLNALCGLAEQVSAFELVHGDAETAVSWLAEAGRPLG